MKKQVVEWDAEKISQKHNEWLKYVKNKHNKKYVAEHPEEIKEYNKKYVAEHPEEIKEYNEKNLKERHKGGKYHKYYSSGIVFLRNKVRSFHRYKYRAIKRIIDPKGLTQIHHQWLPETDKYTAVALVEKNRHLHGYINVIQILEGKITLITEKDIRKQTAR